MMLNESPGAWITGVGTEPAGASHPASSGPSSVTRRAAISRPASAAAAAASRNSSGAPQSATIAAICSGVAEGASGVGTHPARSAPRNSTATSSEVAPRIAIASPRATPSRWSAAATRSMPWSSWA